MPIAKFFKCYMPYSKVVLFYDKDANMKMV